MKNITEELDRRARNIYKCKNAGLISPLKTQCRDFIAIILQNNLDVETECKLRKLPLIKSQVQK